MANEIFLTSNEKFHVFSKSPITPSMGLAQAVNKSGHTTTTADVWSQDIPWFFSADDKATALVTGKNAKLNDLVLIGSAVYKRNATEATEGAAFDTLWESLTLTNGTQLYNSDNKHVLTYHKGVPVDFLTTSNNAKQASNYAGRIFINGKVVEQFVASTDKITDGVPSTGYGVAVYKSGSPLSEGEAEANFIANSYAGIIQFNTKVGPSTAYTADVFEYVGDKLDTTLGNIREEIQDIVGVTMEGVVASVTANDAAQSAGINVDSTAKTSPKITFTEGSVTAGETKLVSGGAVKTYVDTTALAEGGSIAKAIADYVATNAKVSVNGQSATTITVAGTAEGSADLVKVVVTEDKTTENKIGLTLTATLDAAVLNEDGSIDKDGVVIATIAKDIAESVADTAIETALSATGEDTLGGKIAAAQQAAEDAQGTADAALAEAQAKVASITTGTVPEGVSITTGTTPQLSIVTASDEVAGDGNKLVTKGRAESIASWYAAALANSTADNIKAQSLARTGTLSGMFSVATAGTVGTGITGITITDAGLAQTISDAKKAGTDAATAVETLKTTSVNYSTSLGSDADVVTVALGGTVGAPRVQLTNVAAASALTALETKVDNFHKAGVSYKVLDTLPDPGVAYNGVIVLIPSTYGNDVGGDETAAITGSYVEWLCVNKGTEEAPSWDWEQIGTTEADLHDYVNQIHINNYSDSHTSPVYASISSNGYLTLGIDSATSDKLGVSKLFSGHYNDMASVTDKSNTAVSLTTVSEMFSNQESHHAKKDAVVRSINGLSESAEVKIKTGNESGDYYGELAGLAATTNTFTKTICISDKFVKSGTQNTSTHIQSLTISRSITSVVGEAAHTSTSDNSVIRITPEKYISGVNFETNSIITTWVSDMSNLTDGTAMFKNCSYLTTFIGDLSSLETADEMFYGCTLDAESLEILADTLPTVTSGTIDIGASTNATAEVIATIKGKGWTLKSNGTVVA